MIEKIIEIIFNKIAKKQQFHPILKKMTLYWRVHDLAETLYGWTDRDSVLKTLLNISDFFFKRTKSDFMLISKKYLEELKDRASVKKG